LGVAQRWRTAALGGHLRGDQADADLDAVLALFAAAARFDEHMAGAGPGEFARYLLAQQVPSDTVAAHAPEGDRVTVTTVAGAAGCEWDLVVVAGMQQDAWPDTRLRDTVFGAQALAEVLDGRGDTGDVAERRRAVVEDETRMAVLAVSRAKREVVVTAVADSDQRPSAFVAVLAGSRGQASGGTAAPPPPLDRRGVAAQARRQLLDPATPAREAGQAAELLARLAAAGVPGAHPDQWAGCLPLSTGGPALDPARPVTLSPSKVEALDTCGLRWLLEAAGGRSQAGDAATLGSLVHELAAAYPQGDADLLLAALEERWDTLGLGDGYTAGRTHLKAQAMVRRLGQYQSDAPAPAGTEVEVAAVFPITLEPPDPADWAAGGGAPKPTGTPVAGSVRVIGRVDRIEPVGDGEVQVVDYKTSANAVKPADAESNPQLGVYQAVIKAGGWDGHDSPAPRLAGAKLVYLGAGAAKPTERSQAGLDQAPDPGWVDRLLRRCWEKATGTRVTASANPGCRHCGVKPCCPLFQEGRQVTT
jgi:hypothetical protein